MRLTSSVSWSCYFRQKDSDMVMTGLSRPSGPSVYKSKNPASGLRLVSIAVILALFTGLNLTAQTTFTASATGNWNTVTWTKTGPSLATWPGQPGFETEIHDVVINGAGITVSLNVNITSSVRNITITSGTVGVGTYLLTMTGNLSGPGSMSITTGSLLIAGSNILTGSFNTGTGTVNYNGAGQSFRSATYNNLIISGSGTKSMLGAVSVNGNLSITGSATLLTGQYQLTGNATGTMTMAPGTTLQLGSTSSAISVTFPSNFISANILLDLNSTVSYQAAASQTISALPLYGNLRTAGTGIKTPDNDIVVRGNLTIGLGTTIDAGVSNRNLTIGGSWISDGTFVERSGKVTFNGSGTQTVVNNLIGTETYFDLEINSTGSLSSPDNLAVTNTLTMTDGNVLMPGRTFTLGTSAANPGTLVHSAGWIEGTFSRWASSAFDGIDILFPIGTAEYDRRMIVNYSSISSSGLLSANFIATEPTTTGLPLTDAGYLVSKLFKDGYWNHTKSGGFSIGGPFDLKLVPEGFVTTAIDGNTRVVSRFTGSDWFLNGTHLPGSNAMMFRNALNSFTNNYALAYEVSCNPVLQNCPANIILSNQAGLCGSTVTWTPPDMSTICPGHTVVSNYNPGDFFACGTTQVVYYLLNGVARIDSCKFNVTVNDVELPVVACRNFTLPVGPLGTATLTASDIDNGSSDNCSLILVPSRTSFTCADAGQTISVTLTGTDPAGNTSSCIAQVTVVDQLPPVINTKPFTLTLGATGSGILNPSDIDNGTSDNCTPVNLTVSPNSFNCADVGMQTVTFTASDNNGNSTSTTVQVEVVSSLKIDGIILTSCDVAEPYAIYKSDVSGGDGNYNWYWDGLDDSVFPFVQTTAIFPFISFSNTSLEETPFFNNLMPDGSYIIRLIVTDGNACTDTSEYVINKYGNISNNITLRYSTACEGSTVTYTVNNDPAATYTWGVENGTIITSPANGSSVDVLWNTGITRGVVVATMSKPVPPGGSCESIVIDTVSINAIIPAEFDNPMTVVCGNSVVTYTLKETYSDYTWSVTGGTVAGGGTGSSFVSVLWGTGTTGKVTVVAGEGAGCTTTASVDVAVFYLSGSITSLTNVTCNGFNNGTVTVQPDPGAGTSPYEYSLNGSPYVPGGTFSGLAPGIYNITIRDAMLCTYDIPFTITQPPVLTSTYTKTDVLCFGASTGTITLFASGGTLPYQYSLNGGPLQPSSIFTALPAGIYLATVTDANLCTYNQIVTITQPATAVSGAITSQTDVLCFGQLTGSVTVAGSGGVAPYFYRIDGGVYQASGTFNGLAAGSHTVTIRDANLCTSDLPVNILQPATPLTGSITSQVNVLCFGDLTGSVTVLASGGTPAYQYSIDSGPYQANGVFTFLSAGSHTVLIRDANLCTFSVPVLITQPAAPLTGSISSQTNVACFGGATGSVTILATGGTTPYNYSINGGPYQPSGTFTGLVASVYNVTIQDANLCTTIVPVTITQPVAALSGAITSQTDVLCFGAATGSVTIAASGGTIPYSYSINGVTFQPSGTFGGLTAGSYSVIVRDANLCTFTVPVTITEPPQLIATAASNSPVCQTGTITLSGGPNGMTTYSWSGPGGYTSLLQNPAIAGALPAMTGIYTLTITNASGCIATATTSVTVTPLNTITLSSAAGTNNQTGCINAAITPITYNTTGATGATFSGLPTGVIGNWAGNVVTISGVPTVTGTFPYTVTLTGGCGVITATGTIRINPDNTIILTSTPGTDNQSVCINTPLTTITYAVTGATGANFSGLPTGLVVSYVSNVVTIQGTPTTAGTYNYTVTLTGGCGNISATGTIVVVPNSTITLTSAPATIGQTVCINTPLTAITYSTTGATGATFAGLPSGVSGTWAANTVTISGIPSVSGSFPYTVTLTGGCGNITSSGTINVTPDNTITLTSALNSDNQVVCVNTPVALITYATTGANGATFSGLPTGVSGSWAANTVTISGIPSVTGTYLYTVTLTGGCGNISASGSIIVNPDNTISLSSAPGSDNPSLCINTALTDITYITTGANGATFAGLPTGVTGTWAANTVTITGIPSLAGTYPYTVTLTGGCGNITASGTIIVTPDNTVTLTSAPGTDNQPVCINTAMTDVTYSTTGATGATFSGLPAGVNGIWASDAVTISGIPSVAGTYPYTVTLTGGCGTVTASGTIIVNPENTITLTSPPASDNPSVCINVAMTAITWLTTGATGATFAGLPAGVNGVWAANTVTISGTPSIAGSYPYTVTLTGGCGSVSATGTIVVNPDNTITLTSAPGTDTQDICFGFPITEIRYSTTGATGAIFAGLPAGMSFSWNADNAVINGTPSATGVYNYSVTLTGGCGTIVATGRITVNPDNNIILTSASGTDDQELCINTPVTNITYLTTIATGATFTGLPAGVTGSWAGGVVTISGAPTESGTFIYTVDLTGGCGAVSAVGTIVVRPDNTVNLTSGAGTDSQIICTGSPITDITWFTTGADGATFSGLPAGVSGTWATDVVTLSGTPTVTGTFNYLVTLTGGCGNVTATGTIVINELPVVVITNPAPVCAPSTSDLTAAAVTAGSTAGLVFSYWTDAAATVAYLTPGTAGAGTYYIKGTDAAGCFDIEPVTVVVNTPPSGSVVVTDVLCTGLSTGGIDLTVSGGLAPYAYLWSNGSVSEDLSGVPAGNYSVTITDANGCTANASGTISEPAAPLAGNTVVTNATCLGGGADGAIDLTISGGVPPYAVVWSNGAITEDISSLTGGTYNATITDANGCIVVVSATVSDLSVITGDFVITNVSCFGGSNGALDLTVTGGTAPFVYNWSNGETTQDISGLVPGTYTVIITDAFGCTGAASADITEPLAPLSATTAITGVACLGGNTGAVDLTVTGGTAPFTFVWSNSATTEDISGLIAGTYTVTITDANGCTAAASAVVTEPATELTGTVAVTNVQCNGSANGAVNITVSGGLAPYSFLWSNGATTEDIADLAAGTYSVTVTDAPGCQIILTADIVEPEELIITEVHTDASCPGIIDGSITLTITGGTAPYSIFWSDGDPSGETRTATDTIYSVIVTDANACVASLDITVGFSNGSTCIVLPKVITPNDDGKNDKWMIKNIELYPDAEVLIYNRWGQLVYRTKNISANPWDGREKGKLVPADSYHYILYINDGTQPRTGSVTVVR